MKRTTSTRMVIGAAILILALPLYIFVDIFLSNHEIITVTFKEEAKQSLYNELSQLDIVLPSASFDTLEYHAGIGAAYEQNGEFFFKLDNNIIYQLPYDGCQELFNWVLKNGTSNKPFWTVSFMVVCIGSGMLLLIPKLIHLGNGKPTTRSFGLHF